MYIYIYNIYVIYIYIQQFWDARCHQEFTPGPEAFVTVLPEDKEKFKEANFDTFPADQ